MKKLHFIKSKEYNFCVSCYTKGRIVNAKDFVHLYRIEEESTTATANGMLLYYLHHYGIAKKERVYKII
ncbi:hypothetical protein [Thermosipho atlanticus]|uniref:hypothetical protein n=1 Tax=Thermosipho atlanticus TaxID=238991 RepID=UPI0009339F4A